MLNLNGFPALVLVFVLIYVFFYTPIKLIIRAAAHAKSKAEHVRLLHQKTIIAEYTPPANLSPAEIGFLLDSKLNEAEVFATIVSLEQKSIIKISEENGRLLVGSVNTTAQGLNGFETAVVNKLAAKINKKISRHMLSSLRRSTGWVLNKQLRDLGYLVPLKEQVKSSIYRIVFIMLLLIAIFPFLAFRHLNDIVFDIIFAMFLSPFYFVIALILYQGYVKAGGEPWAGTPELKQIWPDVEGYREYIKLVEADNLKFDSENTRGLIKNNTLPYAIALGVDSNWRKKVV